MIDTNPFDLTGPQFLVFYLALAAVTLAALVVHRLMSENGPGTVLTDPYEIAYLRGGWQEAVRLAIASLLERGLVRSNAFASGYSLAEGVTPEQGGSTLERCVLAGCAEGQSPQRLIDDLLPQGVTAQIRESLERQGLLPDDVVRQQRRKRFWVAEAVLLGTALIKIGVALSRGHTNVGFLAILTLLATLAAVRLARPQRTARGDATLHDMSALLAPLAEPERARGLAPSEAAMVGAVFGLGAVPNIEWAQLSQLKPRPSDTRRSDSSGSSGCGASSCGSSCGGGGGGGGCGGGGCGGCGS